LARKKRGKGLFEVISTRSGKSPRQQLGVPGWFGQPRPARPGQEPPSGGETEASAEASVRPEPAYVRRGAMDEPLISVAGGRVRIVLTQAGSVVVCVGLILLLAGAFVLGRRSAAPGPNQQGAAGLPPLPRTRPGSGRKPDDGLTPDDAARQKGYHYLIIQGGLPTRDVALDIKTFLHDNGVRCTIRPMAQAHLGFMVKDMTPFKDINSPRTRRVLADHVRRIEALGKKYMDAGGDYGFTQSRDTLPWMEREK